MSDSKILFWDSCVLYRFLTKQPTELLMDIEQYIEDAQKGERQIFVSTILYAEIRPSLLQKHGFKDVMALNSSIKNVLNPIAPSPSTMLRAARLKDYAFSKDKMQPTEKARHFTTADAIHIATCLELSEEEGLQEIRFHTFDDGKGEGSEGKGVSLLSFNDWSNNHSDVTDVAAVRRLAITPPRHPEPRMV